MFWDEIVDVFKSIVLYTLKGKVYGTYIISQLKKWKNSLVFERNCVKEKKQVFFTSHRLIKLFPSGFNPAELCLAFYHILYWRL